MARKGLLTFLILFSLCGNLVEIYGNMVMGGLFRNSDDSVLPCIASTCEPPGQELLRVRRCCYGVSLEFMSMKLGIV
jgi:hypothetical protein